MGKLAGGGGGGKGGSAGKKRTIPIRTYFTKSSKLTGGEVK